MTDRCGALGPDGVRCDLHERHDGLHRGRNGSTWDRPRSQTYGCGDQTWSNLDSLIRDASSARVHKNEARMYKQLLWAVCGLGGVRVPQTTWHAADGPNIEIEILEDKAAGEYIIRRRER